MLYDHILNSDPRYRAARMTCERTGSPLSVSDAPTAEGWVWCAIAVLCVVGLAVVGLAG